MFIWWMHQVCFVDWFIDWLNDWIQCVISQEMIGWNGCPRWWYLGLNIWRIMALQLTSRRLTSWYRENTLSSKRVSCVALKSLGLLFSPGGTCWATSLESINWMGLSVFGLLMLSERFWLTMIHMTSWAFATRYELKNCKALFNCSTSRYNLNSTICNFTLAH
jgi:hypothetical protein